MGFPSGSTVKNLLAVQEMQEMWIQSLGRGGGGGKSPGANYFLPGESPGQRSLAGIVHGITESDTTETT